MAKSLKVNETESFNDRTRRAIVKIHFNRLATLKKAMNFSLMGKYQSSLEHYHGFFQILAAYYNCLEKDLSPSNFEKNKDLTELFLISQAYWDMAKIYDKNPKLIGELRKTLKQFAKFSIGLKYQYANSQMVLKYLKSGKCLHKEEFKNIHALLNKNSEKCFISTYCFGENHPITNDLREFKAHILKNQWGMHLVSFYYRISPKILNICREYPILGFTLRFFIFYPLLFLTYLFWDKKILKWPM